MNVKLTWLLGGVVMIEAYNNLYDTLFDSSFLSRYGYYDIAIKDKKVHSDSINLENNYAQSESIYFKIFNMECFAKYQKENDLKRHFKLKDPYHKSVKSTEPIYFSIPKNQDSRRQYKMPNLYSFMALNYFICDSKEEFINVFSNNKLSTSKFFNQLNFDYKTTQEIKETLLYGGTKRLHLDLSNFYHTLYTHSIPWMIVGKEQAKKDKKSGFANHLDKFTTLCQYDETHGIPTGNLLSRIISELYMCYFDKQMEDRNFTYSRYVDDFIFPFSLETEKEEFLKEFNAICREHNLIINDAKTSVDIFPFTDGVNKSNLFSYLEKLNSETTISKWIREINGFIDYCIDQESSGNKGAIKALFPVIKNTLKNKKIKRKTINEMFAWRNPITSFNLFEKILDVSLKDSRLTNRFLDFFERINGFGFSSPNASKIVKAYFIKNKSQYRDKINYYAHNHFNQELYQILLYIVEFDVKGLLLKKDLLDLINENIDDFSLILTTMIYLKKRIAE